MLRSWYIAGALGSYGVRSVTQYSTPAEQKSDAAAILLQLDQVRKKLEDLEKKLKENNPLGHVERNRYIDSAVDLIRVAVEPTRREYRRRILGLAGGFNAVGAAGTAKDALAGIVTVERYKQAMVLDAREHAVKILRRGQPAASGNVDQKWRDFAKWCQGQTGAAQRAPAPASGLARPSFIGGETPQSGWWDPLPAYLRTRLCDSSVNFDREDEQAAISAAIESRLDQLKPTKDDWLEAKGLVAESCKELIRLAGIEETQYPCAK